ncbi:hypothetical protein [Hoeflea poritis]|uniref:Uncharacterized protein n=1 Tax=Hoeflea poritis TaxID=2993659 RepID=A0ABT4VL40_9HYPH|nr:hypothetical protein [Hoeflea poritis]MDA4845447.1 hypothetical protein [Hoeflea poritis]
MSPDARTVCVALTVVKNTEAKQNKAILQKLIIDTHHPDAKFLMALKARPPLHHAASGPRTSSNLNANRSEPAK